MPIIDQRLGEKAVDEGSLMYWINRELRPLVRRLRDVVNARAGGYYAETFGDGIASTYAIAHGLGSRDVLVQVYFDATGVDATEAFYATLGGAIVRTDENTVTLTSGLGAPAVDELRAVVRL